MSAIAGAADYPASASLELPDEARWERLTSRALERGLAQRLDAALEALSSKNAPLRGALPPLFEKSRLSDARLADLLSLFDDRAVIGDETLSADTLGRVYEYFLGGFARAEGLRGGQYYTPNCLVTLLVKMLHPDRGVLYDPCCGSGGMFVESLHALGGASGPSHRLRFVGQESNALTWRLCTMNLALRAVPIDLGGGHADTFTRGLHADLRADFVLANPPFNSSNWGHAQLLKDPRWRYGIPPAKSANFAWVQHILFHLAPGGLAGLILPNGSLSSSIGGEGKIRRAIVDADRVDCIVSLPPQLFYSTAIPVSLWLLAENKCDPRFRSRAGETLMIDARDLGTLVDRAHRELTCDDVDLISDLYRRWRGDAGTDRYADIPGLARTTNIDAIAGHKYALVPGRYVGFARPPVASGDNSELLGDLDEIRNRVERVRNASSRALALLSELLDG